MIIVFRFMHIVSIVTYIAKTNNVSGCMETQNNDLKNTSGLSSFRKTGNRNFLTSDINSV